MVPCAVYAAVVAKGMSVHEILLAEVCHWYVNIPDPVPAEDDVNADGEPPEQMV
jgi:hypothetical protein